MTPQSSFMVLAPILPGKVGAMRALLATMTSGPGIARADNSLIRFDRFDNLHSARLVVLDDLTIDDAATLYGIIQPDPPVYLAFLGDFDGEYDAFISLLAQQAEPGLRQIFSLCEGFSANTGLHAWMIEHEQRPAAYYVNWMGRTLRQTREEEDLRRALRNFLDQSPTVVDSEPAKVHEALRQFVEREKAAKRLTLTPAAHTPLGWTLRHWFDWTVLAILLLALIPGVIIGLIPLAILAWILRSQEDSAPEFAPRPDPQLVKRLAVQEDHDVTNQFSAMGPVKPGWLRALLAPLVLWIINLAARTIYTRGRLTRIYTIHFARWVYLDRRRRIFFASVYDGSLESYNDDFINKVSIGLNIVFSNGIGYPRTAWLVHKGAKDEQKFKYYLRRHELPTDVWYNASIGMTAANLQRNSEIRQGLERRSLSDREGREWVALL